MLNKKICLIFGAAGQDGSLMTRYLLKKGYIVYALYQTKNLNLKRFKGNKKLKLVKINYNNYNKIIKIIKISNCREIYFFGGKSSPHYSTLNFTETLVSHVLPVFNILEAILIVNKKIKFFNTSSSEIFEKSKNKLNENSAKNPQNPYGLAKLDSYSLVKFYRKNFKLNCFSGILFNHESKLRPKNFIIPKVMKYIKERNFNKKLVLGDLSAIKDFGWAKEYIKIIHNLMRKNFNEDIVIATGKSQKLSNIVKDIFKKFNLDWKEYVKFSNKLARSNENKYVYADVSKLKKLKMAPKYTLPQIIDFLTKNDFNK
jgi:GDPmannose 4,6-dehydratase